MQRIDSLESLRGILAMWVLVGHVFRSCGLEDENLGPLKLLVRPGYPVDLFIILSGFVIFYLLDHQKLSYRDFIIRRFFRLAPLYFIVLFASAITLEWSIRVWRSLPWGTEGHGQMLKIALATESHFWMHLAAHLTMLHGIISNDLLPSTDYAFVGQAWSISVEWQFYLVAPFLFWIILEKRWRHLAIIMVVLVAIRATNYGGEGFAVRQAGYFILGILSYFLWRWSKRVTLDGHYIDAMAAVAAAGAYMFVQRSVPLLLWIFVCALIVAENQSRRSALQILGLAILGQPTLLGLGTISYSIYLVHGLVILAGLDLIMTLLPGVGSWVAVLILMPMAVVATLAVSTITYRFAEQMGMGLGKRITSQSRGGARGSRRALGSSAASDGV